MTERKSTQLGKFEQVTSTGRGTKGHRVEVHYTRMDGEKAPQSGAKAAKLAAKVTNEEMNLLKALKPGDEFVVRKVEQAWTDQSGQPRTSWALDTVAPKSEWVQPAAKPAYNKGTFQTAKSTGYDNLGQQIGNSITNAVASLGAGHTIDEYKQRALELVQAGDWVREQVTNKTASTNTAPPSYTKIPRPSSSSSFQNGNNSSETNSYEGIESAFADLDSLEFPEGM